MFLDTFEPQPLGGGALLELWSAGADRSAPERARSILCAAFPPEAEARLDELPLGEWNAALLRVRRRQFGDALVVVDRCPHCQEPVELRLSVDGLRPAADAREAVASARHELCTDGCTLRFRPLTGADWRAASAESANDARDAAVRLLRRSVVEASVNGRSVPPSAAPESVWEPLAAALTEADPWSEILFSLQCPRCDRTWESLLEPGDYLWREYAGLARQSLRQVHRLASAYGWSESEILALPGERRSAYIALLDDELGWAGNSLPERFSAPAS